MARRDPDEPPVVYDPDVTYTPEERKRMNARARDVAHAEFRSDPNRKDPKHTQDRMDAAVHSLRVKMGLERD